MKHDTNTIAQNRYTSHRRMACNTSAYLYRSGITMNEFKHENITLLKCDCMEYMATIADNYFELAIVDPPYGEGDLSKFTPRAKGSTKNIIHESKNWNNESPTKKYFDELFRVSKNQIIWGANHYPQFLTSSRGWIFWDKIYENTFNFSAGELAYTSFDRILKMHRLSQRWVHNTPLNIHPCQKPIKLYEWLLTNYAKQGDKILDTHLGSASSAISANNLGFEFVGMELDKDYYDASVERFEKHISQAKLFDFPVQEKQLNQAVIF